MTGYQDIIPAKTNPQVKAMIPTLIRVLHEHVGRNNQIYSDAIITELILDGVHPKDSQGELVKSPKAYIGKAIQIIRCYHIVRCVASTSRGYYIANDPEDYEQFLHSMNERAKSADMVLREAEIDMEEMFPDFESVYVLSDDED